MAEVTWDDLRRGDHVVIRQNVPIMGPRKYYSLEWCGVVTEHNPKWTKLKHAGVELSVPTKHGVEEILRMTKKEFNAYVKENYS